MAERNLMDIYHQAEAWGRELLGLAERWFNESGRDIVDTIETILALVFRQLHRAQRARGDLRGLYAQQGLNDPAHDAAIQYIDNHLISRANNLLSRAHITYQPWWIHYSDDLPIHATRQARSVEKDTEPLVEPVVPHETFRSCFMFPQNKTEAYFFSDMGCVRIYADKGALNDYIVQQPKVSAVRWEALARAKIWGVNAALPCPDDETHVYFFSGRRYAKISITADEIVSGPAVITDNWRSLKEARFETVDAVLPNPDDNKDAYFFSGSQYALIRINPGSATDYIINGPKDIQSEWPSLKQVGFKTIDAILPRQLEHGRAFFFSGTQYADIKVAPGTTDDKVIDGPKDIAENWKSLYEAGIYNKS